MPTKIAFDYGIPAPTIDSPDEALAPSRATRNPNTESRMPTASPFVNRSNPAYHRILACSPRTGL